MRNKSIFSKKDKKLVKQLFRANLKAAKKELLLGKASVTRIDDYISTLATLADLLKN